ncbi:hypothetical protein RUM43_001836 [Polyplax serrata]|uniref:FAD dependent oxidoreductase domain-containing protein n=1 Tax=Polyplax serrata TaxID=468196 RepID=A0AAN8SG41_POLSC
MKFGVLGAGVIGLSTGLELQKQYPNASVTLIAEKFNRETTSDVAAGIFRPGPSFSTHSEDDTRYVIEESFKHYDEIRRNHDPLLTGVSEVSGYIFSSDNPSIVENELIQHIVPLYRKATEEELKICPGNWNFGSFFTTVLTECRRYLPWCLHRFQENHGQVIETKIGSFNDLSEYNFDVVFNCSGFGAKSLLKDRKLVPIRGQVIKVSAPWIKNFFYADYDTYVIPGLDGVTLGGCRNYDGYDTNLSRHDSAAIWERCTRLVPSLMNCTIERECVGLRPHRDPVRIETELIQTKSKPIKCVHNYGHGGYGVTTAPGSAKLAVKFGHIFLNKKSKM